ncbi:MAG: hypothetical protein LBE71_00965, partial [Dysgonamonadaceae bacterium]|nr:hypothetical protein [Dysgonamonadaceae bacterium]
MNAKIEDFLKESGMYKYRSAIMAELYKIPGVKEYLDTRGRYELPFAARKASIAASRANFDEEIKVVDRMLGKAAPITITNQRIKPGKDTEIVVAQSTKDGEFAEVYTPGSVLADGDPVEIFGTITKAGIVLWSQAEEGDAYHEAFHWVELLYLNDRQRARIYNQVRKEHGKSKYTDRQCSEVLAERMKKMVINTESAMVNKSDNIVTRALKSIYRFMGWMNYLIQSKTVFYNQKSLFDAIYNGHFRHNTAQADKLDSLQDNIYAARTFGDIEFKYIKSIAQMRKIIETIGDRLADLSGSGNTLSKMDVAEFILDRVYELGNNDSENSRESGMEIANATRLLYEIKNNIKYFFPRIQEYIGKKYNIALYEDEDSTDNSLGGVEDAYDDDSAVRTGWVQRSHGINTNKLDMSKTSSVLVKSIINSLVKDSSIDPETGLNPMESPLVVWYEIPNKLGNAKTVDEMTA